MPTKDEFQELLDNTMNEWTQVDGVGKYGRVWSSSLSTSYHSYAWDLGFLSVDCSMYDYVFRYGGLSVRGVVE